MAKTIINSRVIEYGNYTPLCGLDIDNNLYIASTDIEAILKYRPDSSREKLASKSFKLFAGKGFRLGKKVCTLDGKGNQRIAFYKIETFLTLIKWELTRGNKQAINIVIAGFADSFSSIAYEKLGVEFKDRQRWLKSRQEARLTYPQLTDELKRWGFTEPWQYAKFTSTMQNKLKIKNGTRDEQDDDKLMLLHRTQVKLATYIECGIDPWKALDKI